MALYCIKLFRMDYSNLQDFVQQIKGVHSYLAELAVSPKYNSNLLSTTHR